MSGFVSWVKDFVSEGLGFNEDRIDSRKLPGLALSNGINANDEINTTPSLTRKLVQSELAEIEQRLKDFDAWKPRSADDVVQRGRDLSRKSELQASPYRLEPVELARRIADSHSVLRGSEASAEAAAVLAWVVRQDNRDNPPDAGQAPLSFEQQMDRSVSFQKALGALKDGSQVEIVRRYVRDVEGSRGADPSVKHKQERQETRRQEYFDDFRRRIESASEKTLGSKP